MLLFSVIMTLFYMILSLSESWCKFFFSLALMWSFVVTMYLTRQRVVSTFAFKAEVRNMYRVSVSGQQCSSKGQFFFCHCAITTKVREWCIGTHKSVMIYFSGYHSFFVKCINRIIHLINWWKYQTRNNFFYSLFEMQKESMQCHVCKG